MSEFIISPNFFLAGELYAPASKSVAQRAIAAACMADGKTILKNIDFSNDVLAALHLAESLGSRSTVNDRTLEIDADFRLRNSILDVGEAGLSTRMFMPIAGLLGQNFKVVGQGSILRRPMNFVADTLRNFGLDIALNNGFLPFSVSGQLKNYALTIDASESSQLLTGILMALPMLGENSEIRVKKLKSKPYIDLTLELMEEFGVFVKHQNYELFKIQSGKYQPTNKLLEGDWSGAAFWFVAAAIHGNLKIFGLNPKSKQADRAILDALDRAGAKWTFYTDHYRLEKSDLQAFSFDATDCPDLFPPLAVLAVAANGKSVISGVHRLIHKESNRAQALVSELSKMGITIYIEGDNLLVEGAKAVHGSTFNSHNDHRMAMTGAILGLLANSQIRILNPQCVSKSYPTFFEELQKLMTNPLII